MAEHPQYWIVGSGPGGVEDRSEAWVAGGYWELDWSKEKNPEQHDLREQMRKGDRIAIKKNVGGGGGHSDIIIKALGIIEAVDPSTNRVHVDWKLRGLDRQVPSRGNYSAINPPIAMEDDLEWVREVFSL